MGGGAHLLLSQAGRNRQAAVEVAEREAAWDVRQKPQGHRLGLH